MTAIEKLRTITICGSMRTVDQMVSCANDLEESGISCYLPTLDEPVDYAALSPTMRATVKARLIRSHIEKINASDGVLIYNATIGNRESYIGANSFLEMGFAFAADKAIFLLNDIPIQPNSDEIAGMLPICLRGNLALIRH